MTLPLLGMGGIGGLAALKVNGFALGALVGALLAAAALATAGVAAGAMGLARRS